MEEIYMYGSGECDQLGDIFKKRYDDEGNEMEPPLESKIPRKLNFNISLPKKINKICCGGMFTLALTNYGEVYSWGSADDGSLGRKGPENTPIKLDIPCFILDITAGDCHGVAYNNNLNQIYWWGSFRNVNGLFSKIIESPILFDNDKLQNQEVKKIKSGANHIVFLTKLNRVFCVGNGEFGQIGRDPTFHIIADSDFIPNLFNEENIEDIFTGYNHSFLLQKIDDKKILKAWGRNTWGQLGIGEYNNCYIPKIVKFPNLAETEVIQCAGGENHSIALTNKYQVYVWGDNDENQCGNLTGADNDNNFTTPRLLEFFNDNHVTEIRSNSYINYAFNPESGKVYSWGMGEFLTLGNKTYDNKISPELIPTEFFKGLGITDISLGLHHVATLLRDPSMRYVKEKKFEFTYNVNPEIKTESVKYNNDMRRRDDDDDRFPFKYIKTEVIKEDNFNTYNFSLYRNKMDIEYDLNNVPSQNNYIGILPINIKNNDDNNGFTYDKIKYSNYNNTSSEKKNLRNNNLNNNVNIIINTEQKSKKKINVNIRSNIKKSSNKKKLRKINKTKEKSEIKNRNSSSKKNNKENDKKKETKNNTFHLMLRSTVKKNNSPSKKKSPSKTNTKTNQKIKEEEPKFLIKVNKFLENEEIPEENNLHVIQPKENKSKKKDKTIKNESKSIKNKNNNKKLTNKKEKDNNKKKSRTLSKPNKRKKLSVNIKIKKEPELRRSTRLKEKKERKKFNEFI